MDLNITTYKLNTGQFQVSYQNPLNGKRKRHKFDLEKDAKHFKEELERKSRSGNLSHFSDMYVAQLIERHLADCPDSKFIERKNTFESFCEEFGRLKLNGLTKTALKLWFAKIKEKNDYSDRTLANIKVQVNYLFRFLVDEGLLTSSPLDQIQFKRHPPPKKGRIVLSVEEVRSTLRNAKTFSPDLLYVYLSCVAHTGARRQEIINLNREDIDFETGLIHLRRTKNGRQRFVRMSPILEGVLKDHLSGHNHQPLLHVMGKRFTSHGELPTLMNKFKEFFPVDKNGWGSHSLRHSFAYNFLKKGGHMYQLQAILGHRSIDVTIDLYGQLQAQDISCPSPYEP